MIFSLFGDFTLSLARKYYLPSNVIYDTFASYNITEMDNHSVKENISRRRKASGLSQTEMAEKLGMSRTAYRNIEKGSTQLISGKVDQIASVLDTTTEEIVLGYKPSAKDSMKVQDIKTEYDRKTSELISQYEDEKERLLNQIAVLKDHIDTLKDSLRTKDEMIAMLKKKLAKESEIE